MEQPYGLTHKAISYVQHLLKSGNEHSIHSPQVFALYNALKNVDSKSILPIYELHQKLKRDKRSLSYEDPGRNGITNTTTVGYLAKKVAKSAKIGRVLHNLVGHLQPWQMLELGTSLGLSAMYQHSASPNSEMIAVEGVKELAQLARKHAGDVNLAIDVRHSLFDDALDSFIVENKKFDYIYLDGHHQLNPSRNYFNKIKRLLYPESIVVFDDIHWSAGMETFWKEVVNDAEIAYTIDLYHIGIAIIRPGAVKQHFSLRI